jgi:coenzyme F420-reducing hydrogenase beta subunit
LVEVEKSMRDAARKLLEDERVDVVIGYERGTLPLRVTPCFVTDVADVDKLIWDVTCENNLANYLPETPGRVGVVAKGCDARSIVTNIVEKQIDRENVVVIGLPCEGVIDRKKVAAEVGEAKEVLEGRINDGRIIVKGKEFERTLPVPDVLDDSCLSCKHRNPPLNDVQVGDQVPEAMGGDFVSASRIEGKSSGERWLHFTKELGKCIRCYACRNACPSCYCKECFVDQNMPTWLGKTDDASDTMCYHIVRVIHVAGRCVDCGACSRACPMGIDLRELTQEMVKLVKELYDFEAGLSLEDTPPMATFTADDPQEFIR